MVNERAHAGIIIACRVYKELISFSKAASFLKVIFTNPTVCINRDPLSARYTYTAV